LELDRQYVFFLRAVSKQPGQLEVMLDGTRLYKKEELGGIEATILLTPSWEAPQVGLSTVLVPSSYRIKHGEDLALYFGCKNVSDERIVLRYRDWPLNTHTYCELKVIKEDGGEILASPHPHLTPDKIQSYFARFQHSYEIALEPNQEFFFGVASVNSAKAGYGYKETLDFKYYPMANVGKYELRATLHNLRAGAALVSGALRIWVE